MPSSISSQVFSPTSLMNIRPVPGWKAKVNGLRSPAPRSPGCSPVAVPKNGLSVGIDAVGVDAQDLAEEVVSVCALAPLAFSPTRDVELAVGAEVDGAAVVVGGAAEVVQVEEDRLAAGHRDVAVGGEAADPVVDGRAWSPCSRRRRSGCSRSSGRRRRRAGPRSPVESTVARSGTASASSAPFLMTRSVPPCSADEEAAVGRERHGGRRIEAARDEGGREALSGRHGGGGGGSGAIGEGRDQGQGAAGEELVVGMIRREKDEGAAIGHREVHGHAAWRVQQGAVERRGGAEDPELGSCSSSRSPGHCYRAGGP